MTEQHYQGTELALFEQAQNWKKYWGAMVAPFFGKRVLEVGAGIGGTTQFLSQGGPGFWLCLEPDGELAAEIDKKITKGVIPEKCSVHIGTVRDLDPVWRFDSILYIDVLEHIEKDKEELERATDFLNSGGCLIILAPAHQALFSPFDAAIGHYRRYDKRSLTALIPPSFDIVLCRYLDSFGLAASLMNKVFLKQSNPSLSQIRFWDRVLVPMSRVMDRVWKFSIGKSVLLIARKR